MARLTERGLRRSVGVPGLFATAYGHVGSSILEHDPAAVRAAIGTRVRALDGGRPVLDAAAAGAGRA